MNWSIIGPSKRVSSPKAKLNWQIIGPKQEQELTIEELESLLAPKPVAYAYKFAGDCPPCNDLERNKHELPVDLVWKPAPGWVQSAPTLHWQGKDGRWYQFAFRRGRGRPEFSAAWRRTQRVKPPSVNTGRGSS